jgi:hypothetical protein
MPNPIIRIHNSETDEIIDREMTDKEVAAAASEVAKYEAAKATTPEQKLFAATGLTVAEYKALGL